MTSLRKLAASDPAIGMIGQDRLILIAEILAFVSMISKWPIVKYLVPKRWRDNHFELRMVAAAFGSTDADRAAAREAIDNGK